jgi:protein-S-isoprenylcysteine O-methyltransferase Ste14
MFGVCRNPLYVGNLLVLLGLFVIHNHPLVYWLGIPFFAGAYFAIVAAEEHFLRAKFGAAFAEYCATVNRFIPDFSRYRDACQDMAFNWRRPLVKEYQTVYAWVMGVLALLSYEKASWGLSAPAPEFQSWRTILIAAAVATAMLGLTKLLKKSRWLTAD